MKIAKRLLAIALVAIMVIPFFAFEASAATLGDVNGNGRIDALDYMLVKRHVIRTAKLTDAQQLVADINDNGRIDAMDYSMIKRHVIGTVVIQPKGYSSETVGDAYEIDDNVFYQYYKVNSGEFEGSESVVTMEFDPADGYIPMVFSGYSGTSGLLETQYKIATQKYGYDVTGIINGAFFSTSSNGYGTLNGIAISNGKIASTHVGYSDSVVAFGTDGSMNIVNSNIAYGLYINGQEIKDGLYYINKTSGDEYASSWSNRFYYYDTSCGRVCDTYEVCPGYEVICEKVDNSELAVGTTLYGKVLEVKADSYGAALAENSMDLSNKFVLFVRANSTNAEYVKDLVAGDSINITVNETIAASREIMENANSVISNVGWLVKDGVDQTQIKSTIGTHSVTLRARWTAFGQKADGSYVFMTSEGGSTGEEGRSITLRDVAKFMIEQGCVNVIRMDGGGSSAMYVKDAGNGEPGYVQSSTRSVGDCILVVKTSSVKDEALEEVLQTKIEAAEELLAQYPDENSQAVVDAAKELLKQDVIVSGDAKRLINKLTSAITGKDRLSAAIAEVESLTISDYSAENIEAIREAYLDALAAFADPDTESLEANAVAAALEALLDKSGEGTLVEKPIYATHFNSSILTGNVTIFTPDFGVISHATANHKWTRNMILTWDETANAYLVTETFLGGGNAKDVNLEANQIFIAAHQNEQDPLSVANIANFEAAQVGQKLVLNNIDVANKTMGVLAYMTFEDVQ